MAGAADDPAGGLTVVRGPAPPPIDQPLALPARADGPGRAATPAGRLAVSATTGLGLGALWEELAAQARAFVPPADAIAYNARQLNQLGQAAAELQANHGDLLLLAEDLRRARQAVRRVTGAEDTEDMLDTLFSRFCLGK